MRSEQRSPELEHAAERMQRSDPQRALSWNTLPSRVVHRVGWLRTGAAEHERERLLPRRPHPLPATLSGMTLTLTRR